MEEAKASTQRKQLGLLMRAWSKQQAVTAEGENDGRNREDRIPELRTDWMGRNPDTGAPLGEKFLNPSPPSGAHGSQVWDQEHSSQIPDSPTTL